MIAKLLEDILPGKKEKWTILGSELPVYIGMDFIIEHKEIIITAHRCICLQCEECEAHMQQHMHKTA